MSLVHRAGATTVLYIAGGVLVTRGRDGLLFEAPPGVAAALADRDLLRWVHGIALSGGRLRSIGGLLPLLGAVESHRMDAPLPIWFPLPEERVGSIADLWMRGWPDRFALLVDGLRPGDPFDTSLGEVETLELPRGEARWRPEPAVERRIGIGWRIRTPDLTVAIGLGSAPTRALDRLCSGADLAILEVGTSDWPPSERPWRLSPSQAITLGTAARELWIVGDDGTVLGGDTPS